MNKDAIIQLAKDAAEKHNLLPEAILAVIQQESGFYTYATRYESAFYGKYLGALVNSGLNVSEATARATSWGLMQVMGQTAREMGFAGQSLAELTDPVNGIEFGCRKLKVCYGNAGGLWKKAFALYNGVGEPSYMYAERVVEKMNAWEVTLKAAVVPTPRTSDSRLN